ncbi:MAG: hypothetical protein ACPGVT_07060 [Maricaulaceae bacterium]
MDFLIFLIFVGIFFGKPILKAINKSSELQKKTLAKAAQTPWGDSRDEADVFDMESYEGDFYEETNTSDAFRQQISAAAARAQIHAMKREAKSQASSKTFSTGSSRMAGRPVAQDMNRQRVKGLSRHKRNSVLDGPEFFAALTLIALGFYLFSLIGS